MAILGNSVGNIIITAVITWTLQRRVALAARLLRGLTCFHITAAGADVSKQTVANSGAVTQRPTKQQAAKTRKRETELGEAGTVTSMPAAISHIEASAFYSYMDTLMCLAPVAIANFLLGEVYYLTGQSMNFLPAVFAALIIALALRSLFMVTVATELSPAIDKWCSLLFATLSGMTAAAVLLACPRGMLSLDTAGATSTLSQASGALLRRKGWSEDAEHVQDPVLHPMALKLGLVLLAAALGGLLLTPMMRMMRSFMSALEVPEWAQQQLHFPAWLTVSLHLNLVLPALGTVIWVNPLFQELLDIPPEWMPAVKAGVMLSIASIQLANTRSLVQSYLNTGLKQWHAMKHGSQGSAAASGAKAGDKIKMKLMVVNSLFVKVAIQSLAPAIILLGCAMIIMQPSENGMLPSRGKSKPAEILQLPISFWICIADFCGWWTCCCWFAFSAGSLSLIKSGLLQA